MGRRKNHRPTKNITTFPSPYRLTATPRTEEIKNKKEFSKMVASTSSAIVLFITTLGA